jgi:hypothetical protein
MAQSLGPTEAKWDKLAPVPWLAGLDLVYFPIPFHKCVKEGRWSRLVMPKVGAARKHGCPATLAGWPA